MPGFEGRRARLTFSFVLAALAVVACADPVAVRIGDFSVTSETGSFLVENRSTGLESAQILIDQREAPLFDPAPCHQWDNRLAPGTSRTIAHADVFGFDPASDSAIVMWCLLDDDTTVDSGTLTLPFR